MKKNYLLKGVASLMLALIAMGCEVGGGSADSVDSSPATTAAPASDVAVEARSREAAPAPAVDGRDQLDISNAKSLGTHAGMSAQNAAVTRTLYAAAKEGDHVSLSFDALNWPSKGDGGKRVDGGVWIFWIDGGEVVGGLFDFHGVGQTVKTLENIYGGYLSGRKPAAGSPIWFALVSLDGSERTNVAQSQTPW